MMKVLIFYSIYYEDGKFYDGGCLEHKSLIDFVTDSAVKKIHDQHIQQIKKETEAKIVNPTQGMTYLITGMTFYNHFG